MKRIATIILTILLAAVLMVMPAMAAENATATITNATGIPGDTVTMTVSLQGFDKVSGLVVQVNANGLEYLAEKSQWWLEGPFKSPAMTKDGIIWGGDKAVNVNTDVLDLTFAIPEDANLETPYTVEITVFTNQDEAGVTATAMVGCGHTYEEKLAGEPNCYELTGYVNVCKYCGDSIAVEGKYFQAEHEYEETVIDPTCTDEGYTRFSCKNCPKTFDDAFEGALGHDMGDWETTKEATTSAAGEMISECTRPECDYFEVEIIPATPVLTVATDSTSGMPVLKWKKIETAETYELYRKVGSDGKYGKIDTVTGTSYTDKTAEPGIKYYYRLRAVSATGVNSAYCSGKACTCDLPQPVVTASNTASTGCIKLSWAKVAGASKYYVYRWNSKTAEYDKIKTTTSTSYTDTTAVAGTSYTYRVTAVHENSSANSAQSEKVKCTCDLAQPVVTASNTASTGRIKLSWAKVAGASKYYVYRWNSKTEEYDKIKTTTSTSYTDTTAVAGTSYTYRVTAVHENSSANSAQSEKVKCTCDLAQPVVKESNVTSSGKIKLEWAKIEGTAKYKIYRRVGKTGDYEYLTSTTSTSYTDKSTTAGTVYYYQVKASHSNSSADSAKSSAVSQTCKLAQPEVTESNVTSSGKIKLEWEKISGTAKYKIYRRVGKTGDYEYLTSTTSTSYTDKSAKAGTVYYYQVKASHSNSSADSAKSDSVGQTCKLARPDVTIKLSSGDPKLTWEKISGVKEYKVYRATSKDGTYKAVKTTTSTSFTDKDVKAGKTYYYKVKAIHSNSSANSAYSSVDYIKAK